MYSEFKDQGLQIVAVNLRDSTEVVGSYVQKGGFTFPIVMNASQGQKDVFDLYGIQACPTNYLIDSSGRILAASLGIDESMKAALKKAGFQIKD